MSENDKKRKKLGAAIVSASVLTAGVVTFAAVQQSANGFQPLGSKRDLQNNQVVFSNDKTSKLDENKSDSNSEVLEKNKDTKNNRSQSAQNTAQYLFAQKLPDQTTKKKVVGTSDGKSQTNDQNGDGKTIYDTSGNGNGGNSGNGDDNTLLPGGNGDGNKPGNVTPGTDSGNGNGEKPGGGNGDGDNPGGNGDNPGNSDDPGNDNPGGNGDNPGNSDDPGNSEEPVPADSAKDPASEKGNILKDPVFNDKPFQDGIKVDEDTESGKDSSNVYIQKPLFSDTEYLYRGQMVDAKTIFDALETYVVVTEGGEINRYIWGADAYNKFVRVDAISFNNGKSWIGNFPVQIPKDIKSGQMKIKMSYRLSTKTNKWVTRIITYDPEDSRVFLMNKKISTKNTTLSKSDIFRNEYSEEGTMLNLYRSQGDFLGTGNLTALFPGWTEHGKRVSWFYPVTAGRHILEPEAKVPLDTSRFTVKMKHYWLTDDYQVDTVNGDNLSYLQTLTDYKGKEKTLSVPKYVQAIQIDDKASVSVDTMKIPDTVLYVHAASKGLRVSKAYEVDKNNLYYTTIGQGVLVNKAVTQICAVPYQLQTLSIPSTIKKVQIPYQNQIRQLEIKAASEKEIPQISYNTLKNTKLIVKDALLENLIEAQQNYFATDGTLRMASSENPNVTYSVEQMSIVSSEGALRKVFSNAGQNLRLSNRVKTIQPYAFSKADNGVSTVVLPSNGQVVQLEENCFAGSGVKTIQCCSRKQLESVREQLASCGKNDIEAVLQQVSQEGYIYCITDDGEEENVLLISAPEDVTEFDGTVTAPLETRSDPVVHITEIGDHAFENCTKLRWVTLAESVDTIGTEAFLGCTSLQGVLIDTKDSIVLGDGAFNGCDSMRFLASNARKCTRVNGYDPLIGDNYDSSNRYFYILHDSDGYAGNSLYFTVESNVESYQLVDIGSGEKVLYGAGADGIPWLALRSADTVPSEINLPATTLEIFNYAFANAKSDRGVFTLNWEELPELQYLDRSCFAESDISGRVTLLPNYYLIAQYAFAKCEKITELELKGENGEILDPPFQDCSGLKTVKMKSLSNPLRIGTFSGCDSLTDITIDSVDAIPLLYLSADGVEFRFNLDWTQEEEATKLRVHVPDSAKEKCIKKWRYYFAGFSTDRYNKTNYYQIWDDEYWDYFMDNWDLPEDEQIDEIIAEKCLKAENQIRTLLGMSKVDEVTQFYPYRFSNEQYILLSVSTDTTDITLDQETLDLPEGEHLDQVGRNAFSKAKNLKRVVFGEKLFGIYPNVFAGVESDSLTLEFTDKNPTGLLFASGGKPYSFGIDESKIHIKVPAGSEQDYIQAWSYALAGYADDDELTEAVKNKLTRENGGVAPTQDQIQTEKDAILLKAENRIRTMMGLKVSRVSESTKTSDNQTGKKTENTKSSDSQTDEKPERPKTSDTQTDEKPESSKSSDTQTDEKPESMKVPENPSEESSESKQTESTQNSEKNNSRTDAKRSEEPNSKNPENSSDDEKSVSDSKDTEEEKSDSNEQNSSELYENKPEKVSNAKESQEPDKSYTASIQ